MNNILKNISGIYTPLFTIIFSFLFLTLNAERLIFSIDYLGFSVANVEMSVENIENLSLDTLSRESNKIITVVARSSRFSNLLTNTFDNIYISYVDKQYRPIKYEKIIKQSNFQEEANIDYCFENQEANFFDNVTNHNLTYQILENTRDFFSTLFFLRTLDLRETHSLSLDVAGKIVLITTQFTGSESLRTNIGRLNTNRIEISFRWFDDTEKMRSDILTNNLWHEENKLIFWFTDDERQIPVRSQYVTKPINVFWSIRSYST